MKDPDPFEARLQSYLDERIRRAGDRVTADRLMERVMRKVQGARRLAPVASVAIAVAVVLLIGAPTTLILMHRAAQVSTPPPAKPTSPPTFATTPPPPSPTPSATPAAAVFVADIAFADANHGWVVGSSCASGTDGCNVLVDSSADGGVTWAPAVVLGQYSTAPTAPGGNLSVRAEGRNIWVAAGGAGIYDSHDGGATWVHSFASAVLAVGSGPTAAWALAGCTSPGASCVLYTSTVAADAWTVAPHQPPWSADTSAQDAQTPSAIDVAPNGALILFNHPRASRLSPAALVSADGGRSWARHQLPCTIGVADLQSPDGKTIWVLCGGGGGAGSGPKAVYVSDDSGSTWQERANNLATPPVGNISFGGYASSLALTAQDVALVGATRGGVIRSTDGGRTWTLVGSHATCLLDGNGVGSLWFLPSGEGWGIEQNSNGDSKCPLLIHTTDGGITWEADGAPIGWTK